MVVEPAEGEVLMEEKTARWMVKVYSVLTLLWSIPFLLFGYSILSYNFGGWGMLIIPYFLFVAFAVGVIAGLSYALWRLRSRSRRSAIVIFVSILLLDAWILIFASSILWILFAKALFILSVIYAVTGIILLFNKDVKALFAKPVSTDNSSQPINTSGGKV